MKSDFTGFPKVARLMRDIIVTEKIDGTNAQVEVLDNSVDAYPDDPEVPARIIATVGDFSLRAGSRTRWIIPAEDNYGFAGWVVRNAEELVKLGPGKHYGEWWGQGIQRNYSQPEKLFSLFNVSRWSDRETRPTCCGVVPVLYEGPFDTNRLKGIMAELVKGGSVAAPGFMKPEGIVVYHVASGVLFKQTVEKDEQWKGKTQS